MVERRKRKAHGWRVSDTARVGFAEKAVSGAQSTEGEVGPRGATEQRCSKELGVGFDWIAAEVDQRSVSSARRSQKK